MLLKWSLIFAVVIAVTSGKSVIKKKGAKPTQLKLKVSGELHVETVGVPTFDEVELELEDIKNGMLRATDLRLDNWVRPELREAIKADSVKISKDEYNSTLVEYEITVNLAKGIKMTERNCLDYYYLEGLSEALSDPMNGMGLGIKDVNIVHTAPSSKKTYVFFIYGAIYNGENPQGIGPGIKYKGDTGFNHLSQNLLKWMKLDDELSNMLLEDSSLGGVEDNNGIAYGIFKIVIARGEDENTECAPLSTLTNIFYKLKKLPKIGTNIRHITPIIHEKVR